MNNEAHEFVGGMPTVSNSIDYCNIAKSCQYERVYSVDNLEDLERVLLIIEKENKLTFLEIKVAIGSRKNLGRPTLTPIENKNNFMNYIN